MSSSPHASKPLARTVCACRRCSICCEHIPGTLAPADLSAIAIHLGHADPQDFAKKFLHASTGATLGLPDGKVITLEKLVPRRGPNGACVFYEQGRCTVHAVSPFGCSHFDAHMSDAEFARCSDALNGAILTDLRVNGLYARTVVALKAQGNVAPPAAQSQASLLAAMQRESLL